MAPKKTLYYLFTAYYWHCTGCFGEGCIYIDGLKCLLAPREMMMMMLPSSYTAFSQAFTVDFISVTYPRRSFSVGPSDPKQFDCDEIRRSRN